MFQQSFETFLPSLKSIFEFFSIILIQRFARRKKISHYKNVLDKTKPTSLYLKHKRRLKEVKVNCQNLIPGFSFSFSFFRFSSSFTSEQFSVFLKKNTSTASFFGQNKTLQKIRRKYEGNVIQSLRKKKRKEHEGINLISYYNVREIMLAWSCWSSSGSCS